MFRGIHALHLDSKGRVTVPTCYRDTLVKNCASRLVITIDVEDSCLLVYPACEWEVIEQKLISLPSFDKAVRRIQRLLIGYATDETMDAQGRILIPPLLRDHSKLKKNVVFVGQGKKFELWDEAFWQNARGHWLQEVLPSSEALPEGMRTLAL